MAGPSMPPYGARDMTRQAMGWFGSHTDLHRDVPEVVHPHTDKKSSSSCQEDTIHPISLNNIDDAMETISETKRHSLASGLFTKLRQHTWGSLTLDLKRTHILDDAFEEAAEESGAPDVDASRNPFVLTHNTDRRRSRPRERFSTNGARCKVMRHVSLGPKYSDRIHGKDMEVNVIDIGVGLSFELDSARIRPKARVRMLRTVSVGLFPCPHVKIQRRMPIGLTGFSLRASYFCPLADIERFYRQPARLIITLDDDQNYGIRLSRAGVEVSGNTWVEWRRLMGYVHASGVIRVPQGIDFHDCSSDSVMPQVEPMRCGLKMTW